MTFINSIIVDGGWSGWSDYSDCSVTCGIGVQNRRRLCNSPPQSGVGLPCSGNSTQTQHCEKYMCGKTLHNNLHFKAAMFPSKHLNISHLFSETDWECTECRDMARSNKDTYGKTWGHLISYSCDQCKVECAMDEDCDGIQCVNIVKTPIPKNNSSVPKGKSLSFSGSRSNEDSVAVGLPCQWLKKPKNSDSCKPNDQYMTCWKTDKKDISM